MSTEWILLAVQSTANFTYHKFYPQIQTFLKTIVNFRNNIKAKKSKVEKSLSEKKDKKNYVKKSQIPLLQWKNVTLKKKRENFCNCIPLNPTDLQNSDLLAIIAYS